MIKLSNLISVIIATLVLVSCEISQPSVPTGSIELDKSSVFPGQDIQAVALITSEDGDPLEYSWSVTDGELRGGLMSDTVKWILPETAGQYSISNKVTYGIKSTEFSAKVDVLPVDYFDAFTDAKLNVGIHNLTADIVSGYMYMEVLDENDKPYGSFITLLEDEQITFNTAMVECGYEPYDEGHLSYVFYFEVDESYEGKQLEAIQLEVKPLNKDNNWIIKYKWKDYSTGDYYWDYLTNYSFGFSALIEKDYNTNKHEIKLVRTDDNYLDFYFDGSLIRSSPGIKNLLEIYDLRFDPTLNRTRFYVHDKAYMELYYFGLYK